ncbi:MAG: hypothetical protein M5U08_04790 [Burkholderiales bacterium]|nr:hypothetical protein [Burkholderiales bacterium]
MAVIEMSRVGKWFGTFQVLRDAPREDFFGRPRSARAARFLSRILHH